jgi:hypothetical protein
LLVAHQTADSPELRARVLELVGEDPAAEFVLLVPATPIGLLTTVGGEQRTAVRVARSRADQGRALLGQAGARVAAARIGNYDPMVAVEEEVRGGAYEAVVISTLPPGVSRWLRQDLPAKVARRFPAIRVIHVVARPAAASAG